MVKIIKQVSQSKIQFDNETDDLQKIVNDVLHTELGVWIEGVEFSKAYKMGHIDGLKPFYDKKSQEFPTGLLPQVDVALKKLQERYPSLQMEYIDEYPGRWVEDDEFPMEIILPDAKLGEITLRDYQYRSVREAVLQQMGLIHVATNGGKTEIGAGIIKTLLPEMEPHEKVVFLVPTKEIFYGAHERLEERLGMEVGMMGDGKRNLKQVNVVLMPSLVSALKDPSKENKVTAKERVPQIVVQEILPLFKGKKNVKTLLQNYMRTYNANTKAREQIKDELTELAYSDLSDAKIQMAMNKYEVTYNKAMEKKAGKKWDVYQETLKFVEDIVCVICDETHRAKGDTWFDTISKFTNAQYRIGMTGTIDYRDKMLWQKLQGLFGQVVEKVGNEELIDKGFSAKPYIKLVNVTTPTNIAYEKDYQTVYSAGIVSNTTRNTMIAKLCQTIYADNKTTLIIVNRVEHGDKIFELLQGMGIVAEFINGELESDTRKRQLADVKSGKLKVLIATTVLDEGVDISGIHCLILGAGGKSLRQTLQRVGRILRKKEGDNQAIVIDFYDRTNKYLLNHSKERHRIYSEEGFDIQFLN